MANTECFMFGSFVLDPKRGLSLDGRPIHVAPKELALLNLFVHKHGQVVSHREIENRIWPRQEVSYASLARCVYSLRKLLEVDGLQYIVTAHKRGYRLAVAVNKTESTGIESALTHTISATPLAYSHYSAGAREANNPSPASQARAIQLFEEAVKVDPRFAAATASIADTRMYQVIRGEIAPALGLKLGLDACHRALEVNPYLVQATAALAWFTGAMMGQFEEAHAILDATHSIDPGYSRGYIYRSWIFRCQGLAQESVVAAQRAVDTDPHALLNRHSYSWALFCCDRAAEALTFERELQQTYTLDEIAHGYVGITAAYLGKHKEACAAIETAMQLSSSGPSVCAAASYILAKAGKTERALELAEGVIKAKLPRASRAQLAPAYIALGDTERALNLLRDARDEGCAWLAPARLDPRLSSLKSDDRFSALFS